MASSCKRRPHHHDHGEDHHNANDDDDRHYDLNNQQQPHRCSKSVNDNGNRFTTSSRRLMQFHINSSSLTLAAVFMLVAVLLMPHHQVLSQETGGAEALSEPIDYTTEYLVQPTTLTTDVKISAADINNDQKPNEELINAENDEQRVQITKTDKVEHVQVADKQTSINVDEVVEAGNLHENANMNLTIEAETHNNHNQTETQRHSDDNISDTNTTVDVNNNVDSPQTVDNDDNAVTSTQMVNNAPNAASSRQTVDNADNSPQSFTPMANNEPHDAAVSPQTPVEKPTPSIDEEFYHKMPLHVEESSVVELHEHHDDVLQTDVNNDIFSSIVEVSPEIKTSPDFIDSQPGKTGESTENLEQSIRNSVKTEIELEQNLESSPVLEILKDITEPEIRQTLTEDLIESDIVPASEAKRSEDHQNEELVETKEDQTEHHVEQPVEVVDDEPEVFVATLDETCRNSGNSRGARNLEIQTSNEHQNETSQSITSSSSSSSSQSKSEETNKTPIANETTGEDKESEVVDETEKEQEHGIQSDESQNDDNEQLNNAQEEFDKEESEADLKIPETSQELHATVTTPTSDIALLEGEDQETVSGESDEALSVVLNESLSQSTVPNMEEESLISVEQKEQKTSLDVIAAEEADSTEIPEESEHIVIKKVLDEQEIFPDAGEEITAEPVVGLQETKATAGVIVEEPHPTVIEVQNPLVDNNGNDESDAKENEPETTKEKVLLQNPVPEPKALTPIENVEEQDVQDDQELLNVSQAESDIKEEDELAADVIVEDTANDEEGTLTENLSDVLSPEETDTVTNEQEQEPKGETQNEEESDVSTQPTNKDVEISENVQESQYSKALPSTTESPVRHYEETPQGSVSTNYYFASTTEAVFNEDVHDIVPGLQVDEVDSTKTVKGSRSVNRAIITDDVAATLFEAYPPHDSDQTFNGNLADESAGIGKALPVTENDASANRSTVIIILSSGTAVLFIVVSVTIFLISFQRQHGTLDIEMQERSCGKDNLDEEDAETFAKLLEVELPPSVAIALEETEECL